MAGLDGVLFATSRHMPGTGIKMNIPIDIPITSMRGRYIPPRIEQNQPRTFDLFRESIKETQTRAEESKNSWDELEEVR
jgi:hypothetical protein